MTFTKKNSGLVKVWVSLFLDENSPYELADVSELLNFKDVVTEVV